MNSFSEQPRLSLEHNFVDRTVDAIFDAVFDQALFGLSDLVRWCR